MRKREVMGGMETPDEGMMTWREVVTVRGRRRKVIMGKTGEEVILTGGARVVYCEQTGDFEVVADTITDAGTIRLTTDQASGFFPDLQADIEGAIASSRREAPLAAPRIKDKQ